MSRREQQEDHEENLATSKRYVIHAPVQSTNARRIDASDKRSYTGDVIEEYWCGCKIREHKYTFTATIVQPPSIHFTWAAQDGHPPPQPTVQLRPSLSTTDYFSTYSGVLPIPSEILEGKWKNTSAGSSYVQTAQIGQWGIYARKWVNGAYVGDWTDAYTELMFEPYIEKINTVKRNARAQFNKIEKHIGALTKSKNALLSVADQELVVDKTASAENPSNVVRQYTDILARLRHTLHVELYQLHATRTLLFEETLTDGVELNIPSPLLQLKGQVEMLKQALRSETDKVTGLEKRLNELTQKDTANPPAPPLENTKPPSKTHRYSWSYPWSSGTPSTPVSILLADLNHMIRDDISTP
jgi:hypothetical protein